MKNLLSPLAKGALKPLHLIAGASVADTGIHKKKFGLEQQLYNFKQRNEQLVIRGGEEATTLGQIFNATSSCNYLYNTKILSKRNQILCWLFKK